LRQRFKPLSENCHTRLYGIIEVVHPITTQEGSNVPTLLNTGTINYTTAATAVGLCLRWELDVQRQFPTQTVRASANNLARRAPAKRLKLEMYTKGPYSGSSGRTVDGIFRFTVYTLRQPLEVWSTAAAADKGVHLNSSPAKSTPIVFDMAVSSSSSSYNRLVLI
jgi:hypothetical protein